MGDEGSGFAIGLIDHGVAEASVRGAPVSACAGRIVVIEPFVVHACHPAPATSFAYRMFYVGAAWFPIAGDQFLHFASPVIDTPALFDRLSRLFDQLRRAEFPESLRRDLRDALTTMTAVHGRIVGRTDEDGDHRIRTMCRRLSREPVADASLAALAADVGMSRAHFSRSFKTETGLTPHAFVALMRVERAKRLLTEGVPIAAVAIDAGFSDQSHFARVFRRFAGATPAQYRAATADVH